MSAEVSSAGFAGAGMRRRHHGSSPVWASWATMTRASGLAHGRQLSWAINAWRMGEGSGGRLGTAEDRSGPVAGLRVGLALTERSILAGCGGPVNLVMAPAGRMVASAGAGSFMVR